ncbi:putative transcriptional regulatory protein pdtaR [Fundidesulfovibrio magnetotacticus]|uniref:Putative transcriptional regulatory protein pdtaR n=1 Tax=Fundidesulfovibrio magnetotacticus TaxID=2730080 RepID=A0A6V8LUD3_9BACT|nr:response regulator [Fundidesulfovibrio magnetotacticus]GFK93938.1 putative transcriptional regulatory protein pdtaR [Fundidesulfovibrio magnetotacticus]
MSARVMIVEDEVIAAMATEKMLRKLGYEVCGNVTSGEEALALSEALCPDIVIMDIRLDGQLDGIDTSLKIKELCEAEVVFVSAYCDDKTRSRAQAANPRAFVSKPLDIYQLKSILGDSPVACH